MSELKPGPRSPRAFSVTAEPEPVAAPEKPSKAKPAPRKPRAVAATPEMTFSASDEAFFAELDSGAITQVEPPKARLKSRWKLGSIAVAAFGILVSLAVGLWADTLIRDLLARNLWLGRFALGIAAIFAVSVLALIAREMLAIRKQRNIASLRDQIETALETGNNKEIKRLTAELESHFQDHPKTATGRSVLAQNRDAVMDATDRYALTERELLAGLDREATQIVMNSAKRVSVVTAVSPRALVDIGYVLYENVRLMRVMAEHYGGRSGTLGTITLIRRVISHLAVTGTIAIGDGLLQQVLGHGLAARLSARLGEGVVNGLMTARVGLAAMEVCRPAPFLAVQRPKLGDFARTLTRIAAPTETQS